MEKEFTIGIDDIDWGQLEIQKEMLSGMVTEDSLSLIQKTHCEALVNLLDFLKSAAIQGCGIMDVCGREYANYSTYDHTEIVARGGIGVGKVVK